MAGTLADMKSRIADEIARSDLTTNIADAITTSITTYQKERFRFSESRDTTFNTVATQEFYTSADNPVISNLYYFDYLTILIGDSSFDVPRYQPEDLELLSQSGTQAGQPYAYTYYNEQIRLYPTPSAVYEMRIGGHLLIAAPTSDAATGNRWMTDGEKLIRCRSKYELAVHVTKDNEEAARMSPDPPGPGEKAGQSYLSWRELKDEVNKLTARGVVRPMYF